MTNPTRSMVAPAATIGARLREALPLERLEGTGFPGRRVGGAAMVLGPLLMLTGASLRARFHFFYPDQLAAYERHPTLMATAYGLFAAGSLLLWPAVAVVAARIGARSVGWGLWGGVLVMFGLFARAFHAGVDHLAFQLVRSQGVEAATEAVSAGYGAFHVFAALNLAILAGWIVLALGAWRTRVLGPVRAAALGLTAALPLGVLKGTTPLSLVALAGLCAGLVPLGLALLGERPRPSREGGVALGVTDPGRARADGAVRTGRLSAPVRVRSGHEAQRAAPSLRPRPRRGRGPCRRVRRLRPAHC